MYRLLPTQQSPFSRSTLMCALARVLGEGRGVAVTLLVCESNHWLYLRGTRMTFRSLDTS